MGVLGYPSSANSSLRRPGRDIHLTEDRAEQQRLAFAITIPLLERLGGRRRMMRAQAVHQTRIADLVLDKLNGTARTKLRRGLLFPSGNQCLKSSRQIGPCCPGTKAQPTSLQTTSLKSHSVQPSGRAPGWAEADPRMEPRRGFSTATNIRCWIRVIRSLGGLHQGIERYRRGFSVGQMIRNR